jgi:hypothetical protein
MAIAIRAKQSLTRRQWLVRSASTVALAGMGGIARPYLSRAADREGENLAPCFGLQFFGRVDIDSGSGIMTVTFEGSRHRLCGRSASNHGRRRGCEEGWLSTSEPFFRSERAAQRVTIR